MTRGLPYSMQVFVETETYKKTHIGFLYFVATEHFVSPSLFSWQSIQWPHHFPENNLRVLIKMYYYNNYFT